MLLNTVSACYDLHNYGFLFVNFTIDLADVAKYRPAVISLIQAVCCSTHYPSGATSIYSMVCVFISNSRVQHRSLAVSILSHLISTQQLREFHEFDIMRSCEMLLVCSNDSNDDVSTHALHGKLLSATYQ